MLMVVLLDDPHKACGGMTNDRWFSVRKTEPTVRQKPG